MKRISQTLKIALALFVAFFSNSLLPSAVAYAAEGDQQEVQRGTMQPVWCKLTGSGWQAQLAANGNGKDGPLTVPVEGYTMVDGQIFAHDRSNKLDAACEQQYGTILVTAVNGVFNDICGAAFNLTFTPAQTTGVTYVQNRVGSTITVTAVAQTGYKLTNQSWSQSATDSLLTCPPTVIQIPTAPKPNDPCGLNNATWTPLPDNTASYTWSLVNGHLIVTATQGYIFSGNTTSHDYGIARDSGAPCTINVPQKPESVDPCGTRNAYWVLPSDTATIHWSLNQHDELLATAQPGNVFSNDKTVINFGNAHDSNIPCVKAIPLPEAPKPNDPCGLHNAQWSVPHDTLQIEWSLNHKGELIATAKAGYIFENKEHSHNFGKAQDSGKLCPVKPEAPTFIDNCGPRADAVSIPSVRGVVYKIDGVRVNAGHHNVNGNVTVTAVATDEDYVLVGDDQGPWTYVFRETDCVMVTKSSLPVSDTNSDGMIGVGDIVTWNITVTNTSDNDLDNFRIALTDSTATLQDNDYVTGGVIKYLKHGASVSVIATSKLTADDVKACKATNIVTFQGWYTRKYHEIDRDGHERNDFSLKHNNHDSDEEDEYDISGTSNSASAAFTCPTPGRGDGGGTTVTTAAEELPAVLPSTGPSESTSPFVIVAMAVIAYGATYFLQRRRETSTH